MLESSSSNRVTIEVVTAGTHTLLDSEGNRSSSPVNLPKTVSKVLSSSSTYLKSSFKVLVESCLLQSCLTAGGKSFCYCYYADLRQNWKQTSVLLNSYPKSCLVGHTAKFIANYFL